MTTATRHLLIVFHSQSGSTRTLAEAVIAGAGDEAIAGVEIRIRDPLEATPTDVRWANAIILGTPENFGYMSGALKFFFDHIYYPCLEHTQGLGYAVFIKAGNDGQGALSAITRITTGLAWRLLAEPLIVAGSLEDSHLAAGRELGMTIAAGLEAGLF